MKVICYYCKDSFEYSLKCDLLPVCGKQQCRDKYIKDYNKVIEILANICGRTARGLK